MVSNLALDEICRSLYGLLAELPGRTWPWKACEAGEPRVPFVHHNKRDAAIYIYIYIIIIIYPYIPIYFSLSLYIYIWIYWDIWDILGYIWYIIIY